MTVLLVSAGPSREYFDDVRYLSNGATGALGIAIAEAGRDAGFEVHLALGPTHLSSPPGVTVHAFVSALELSTIAEQLWPRVHAFVATAAVCDYRPASRAPGKRKKAPGDWDLRMIRNPDILLERSQEKGDRTLVGFALEATVDRVEARRKLAHKQLDVILLNTVANMGSSAGSFSWIEADGRVEELSHAPKTALARRIVDYLRTERQASGRC